MVLNTDVLLLTADKRRAYFLTGDRTVRTPDGDGKLLYLALDESGMAGVRIEGERRVDEWSVAQIKAVRP